MQVIPLNPVPSQTISVSLGGQACSINIYQKVTGLYLDLLVNGVLVVGGRICENLNRIVRSVYLGFIGDLCFVDQEGTQDPDYTGFGQVSDFTQPSGARYLFLYLTPSELANANLLYGD